MRLSREDGKGESSGIESQRLLLESYAREHGFSVYGEYVDDGYSGTSYERPAFRRLQKDIEAGLVNLVIAKDLSRLGRNYIATGELTEEYFPEHFVRFIAINDGYDSEYGGDDMTPFRHVVNEMYARDISRKIRSALHAKIRAGQYIGSFAPYGYRKMPGEKNRLVPDPGSAGVVRKIFDRRALGDSPAEIAQRLNGKCFSVPLDYRNSGKLVGGGERKWSASSVSKILHNPVYIGNTVQGKNRKISFRSPVSVGVPREKWVVVEHTHEAIVPVELFERVTRRKKREMPGV